MGLFNRLNWEQGVEGWCMFLLTKYLGWQLEEVMVFVAQMRKALRDRTIHPYHEVYVCCSSSSSTAMLTCMLRSVVFGRKPVYSRR